MPKELSRASGFIYSQRLSLLLLLFAVVAVPLYFDNGTYDVYTATKHALVEVAGLALFVFFIYGLTDKLTVRLCFSPLGVPVAAYLGISALSLLLATNIYAGFARLFFMLSAAVFFLTCVNLVKSKMTLRKITIAMLAALLVVSLIGILQYFHDLAPVSILNEALSYFGLQRLEPGKDTYGRDTYCSTFGHANFAGQYLVTLAPLALAMAVWAAGRWRKSRKVAILAVVCALASVIYLGITFCRGAWVGMLGAVSVMLIFSPYRKKFLIAALAAIAIAAAASPFIKDDEGKSMAHKFATTFDTKDSPTQFRFLVWKSSLRVAKEEPLGVGVGNFRIAYPKYRTVEERRNTGWDKVIYKAHNDYVQTLVEQGVAGFAAYLWMIFVVLKMAITTMKRSQDDFVRAASLGLLGGISGMLIHSFFSSNFQLPGSGFSFWVVLGLFASTHGISMGSFRPCLETRIIDVFGKPQGKAAKGEAAGQTSSGLGLVRVLLLAILLMGLTIPLRALLADYHFGYGQYYENLSRGSKTGEERKENIDQALMHLRKAVWAAPRDYEIRYYSSVVEDMAQNFDIAEIDNAMAVKLAPYFDHIVNHYGTVLYNQAKFAEAMVQFKRALELNPVYADAMLRLGNVYRELGDYEAAIKQYDDAQKTNPTDARPLFNKGVVLHRIGEELVQSEGYTDKALQILNQAKEIYERCLKIKEDNIKVLNNLGALQYTLKSPTEARKLFEKSISIIPDHISARVNLAALCEAEGDWDCAIEQYQALVRISGGRVPRFLDELEKAKAKKAEAEQAAPSQAP